MTRRSTLLVLVASLGLTASAHAGSVLDRLTCFKVKDSAPKAVYTATLAIADPSFPASASCTVKVPAKLLCLRSQLGPTTPASMSSEGQFLQVSFACYKVKCPKVASASMVLLDDQFGSRSGTLGTRTLLCAPGNFSSGIPG